MNQHVLETLAKILANNIGNRLTPELVTGIVQVFGNAVKEVPEIPPSSEG